MNYRNIINKGAFILRNNAILTANLDAEILLSNLLNNDKKVKDSMISFVLLKSIENPILEKVEVEKILEMILNE